MAAQAGPQFSDAEVEAAVSSIRNLVPGDNALDWAALRALIAERAREPHTDWAKTREAGLLLGALFPGGLGHAAFRALFARALRDGHWEDAAAAAAKRSPSSKPWAVLVTGTNGIRKTTSVYQPWFRQVLRSALTARGGVSEEDLSEEDLPDGMNSFFRQLDHVIASVVNEEFRRCYELDDVDAYSAGKESIFKRYRTLAEMAGVCLIEEARKNKVSVMVETSGKDASMYDYIQTVFPDDEYRKLLVHFEIDQLSFAERSVDARMRDEMARGAEALRTSAGAAELVAVNVGGPYGSKVLEQVTQGSQRTWHEHGRHDEGSVKGWLKAHIAIVGAEEGDWTAHALAPDGTRASPDFPIQRL